MKFLVILFLSSLSLIAQTAIIPTAELCPVGQLMIANPTGTISSYTLIRFVCATVDSTVTLNKNVTPWIFTSGGSPSPGPSVGIPYFGVFSEVPSGAINGTNVTFSLSATPSGLASVLLFKNGLLQPPNTSYSINGNVITMNTAPSTNDILIAYYLMLIIF